METNGKMIEMSDDFKKVFDEQTVEVQSYFTFNSRCHLVVTYRGNRENILPHMISGVKIVELT